MLEAAAGRCLHASLMWDLAMRYSDKVYLRYYHQVSGLPFTTALMALIVPVVFGDVAEGSWGVRVGMRA